MEDSIASLERKFSSSEGERVRKVPRAVSHHGPRNQPSLFFASFSEKERRISDPSRPYFESNKS